MQIRSKQILLGSFLGLAVAACDGGGKGNVQSQFGQVFAAAFNTAPTGDPNANVAANDIVFRGVGGPDLTADPVDL